MIRAYSLALFLLLCLLSSSPHCAAQQLLLVPSDSSWCFYSSAQPASPLICLPRKTPFLSYALVEEKVSVKLGAIKEKSRERERLDRMIVEETTAYSPVEHHIHGIVHNGEDSIWFRLRAILESKSHLKLFVDQLRWTVTGYSPRLTYLDSSPWHFGFGEQYSAVAMGREHIPFQVEENGIGRGDKGATWLAKFAGAQGARHSTYFPVGWAMDASGRGIYIPGHHLRYWDFRAPGLATAGFDRLGGAHIEVFQAGDPLSLLEQFTAVSGRLRMLPDWAWGAWYGIQGGPGKCRRIVDEAQAAGVPLSAIWIQDWVGKRKTPYGSRLNWHWQADSTTYPDIKGFIQEMNARGVKVLGYINPFLAVESAWVPAATPYLLPGENGKPMTMPAAGFKAHLFDFRTDSTSTWLAQRIREELIEPGFSGWMADFGEWWPGSASKSQQDAHFWWDHNAYPGQWQACNRQALASHPDGDELLFFSRSGGQGAPRHGSLYWTGDQLTGFSSEDGLPSALRAMLSGGMSGISLNHSDIGGYTNIRFPGVDYRRDLELYQRWCELGAFSPVFRTHEGLRPEDNVQPWTDSATVAFTSKMANLHAALKPYWISLNREAAEKGWPVLRHLWLHYPHDPEVLPLDAQFLVGSDLLVFPVIAAAQDSVRGYFPSGEWIRLGSKENISGPGWRTLPAEVGTPAAFRIAGSPWHEVWNVADSILAPNQ